MFVLLATMILFVCIDMFWIFWDLNYQLVFSCFPRNQWRRSILNCTMSQSYTCFFKEEVGFFSLFFFLNIFFSFFPPHILYCCLFTWFWLLKNEDNFCLLFCIDLFPYTYSWHPPSQMVWSWGWIQCHGYWPSWSKPRRPFQLLQSEVLFEDSVNACWSVSKLAIACRNGFYVIKMVAILNFFFSPPLVYTDKQGWVHAFTWFSSSWYKARQLFNGSGAQS